MTEDRRRNELERRRLLAIPVNLEGLIAEGVLSRHGDWYHIEDRWRVPEHLWLRISIDGDDRKAIRDFKFSASGAAEIQAASGSRRVLQVDDEPVEFVFSEAHNRILMGVPDGEPHRTPLPEWILVGRRSGFSVMLEWPTSRKNIEHYTDDELRELWRRKRDEAGDA